MNEQLDPQLARLFASYSPALDPVFLAKLQSALDRSEHRARWRLAVSWVAIVFIAGAIAALASGPLAGLATLVDGAIGNTRMATMLDVKALMEFLPFSFTPLTLTLLAAVLALCLRRRIRAMLVP